MKYRARSLVIHAGVSTAFLLVATVILTPYLAGGVTAFYGFVASPGLLLGAAVAALWLDNRLSSHDTTMVRAAVPRRVGERPQARGIGQPRPTATAVCRRWLAVRTCCTDCTSTT